MYEDFKASVLGKVIGDGQCVALDRAYLSAAYPKEDSYTYLPSVDDADQLAGHSSAYLTWVVNNHSDADQVPSQGDIMVFGPTPAAGYTNTFDNPAGHTGVCDSASSSGYALLQQNAPDTGSPANVTEYAWKFRPCLGWYTLSSTPAPAPKPSPTPAVQTITLPATTGPWHLRDRADLSKILGIINPIALGRALTYTIEGHPSEYIYWIDSTDYGPGAIDVEGSDVNIS